MSILGQLVISLKAETASFIEGMSGAGKTVRTVGKDIEGSLSGLGGAVTSALAPLGEIGGIIGQSLGSVGNLVGDVTAQFAKLGVSSQFLLGAGAAAGAALAATEIGIVGLAVKGALAAAELGELSQKTGVSTQMLGGLSIIAKETGTPLESVAKALGLLNSNAVKAAVGSAGAQTAFSRLGISVRDASGNIKDSSTLFLESVGKLQNIPQPEQGYFVRAIFGRGGMALIPIINQGIDTVREKMELANKVGIGDEQTVAASLKFKETLGDISGEFDGMTQRLAKDLLPALLAITHQISEAFQTGQAQAFIDFLADIVKWTLAVGRALVGLGQEVKNVFSIANPFGGGRQDAAEEAGRRAGEALRQGDFKGAISNVKSGLGQIFGAYKQFGSDSVRVVGDTEKSIKDILSSKLPPLKLPKPGGGEADLSAGKGDTTLDRIKQRIAALQQESADWAKVASAGSQAEQLIAEAVKKGNEEFGKLKAEAAKDKTGAALPFVLKNEDVIKAAGLESVFGAAVKAVVTDLDKQKIKFDEQGKAAAQLGAAFQQGGSAIADAALSQKFIEQISKIEVFSQAHEILSQTLGKEAPIVQQLAGWIGQLTSSLNAAKDSAKNEALEALSTSLKLQAADFQALTPKVQALNAAYLQGTDAVRKATIALELQRFIQSELDKGTVVTQQLIEQKRKLLTDADQQAYNGALLQEAARFSLSAQYDNEIVKLERLREVLKENGQNTLLIDAQLQDAQDKLIQQWDQAAFKVGSFGDKFKGVMGELVIQGHQAGEEISRAFLSAIDSMESNLAKLLTGQKTNFKAVFQNLAEQVTKAKIQEGVGVIASHFGIKLPGGKPDGTANNPLHVILTKSTLTGSAAGAGGLEGAIAKHTGVLGKLFGSVTGTAGPGNAPDGTQSNPFYVAFASTAMDAISGSSLSGGSGLGGGIGSILSAFGGGLADGGDMTPGRWYMTGEHGPEPILAGRSGGRVFPTESLYGGRPVHNVTQNFNYGSASDRDLFNHTDRQIAARHMTNVKSAYR